MIATVPKIFLDTAHLIKISKLRKGAELSEEIRSAYALIDESIRNWKCGLIFSPAGPMEWVDGDATLESAYEIADVVESAKLQYESEMDKFIYLRELLCEVKRVSPSLELPDFETLFVRVRGGAIERAMWILAEQIPSYFDPGEIMDDSLPLPIAIPFSPIREHAQRAWHLKVTHPTVYRERVEGFHAAYAIDRAALNSRTVKKYSKQEVCEWMKRYLKIDRIVKARDARVVVDDLLERIDLSKCPAINLFMKARSKRVRNEPTAKDNDVEDWHYIAIVPHADVFLTERNLRNYIHQAEPQLVNRVTDCPIKAVQLLSDCF